jgi:hypothetical protein
MKDEIQKFVNQNIAGVDADVYELAYTKEIEAARSIIECLANPFCENSGKILVAIIEQRERIFEEMKYEE